MTTTDKPADLLRLVIANVPVIVWTIDRAGIVTMAAGKGMESRSLGAAESLGRNVFDLYAAYPEFIAAVRRALAGERVQLVSETFSTYFDRHLEPMRDAQGRVVGVLGISIDITEYHRAEEALRLSQSLLRSLFDAIPHGLFLKDREGRFTMVNRAMAAKWGLEPEQMVGLQVANAERSPPTERDAILEADRRVLATGEMQDMRMERTLPGGVKRSFRSVRTPVRDGDGAIVGIAGIMEDVTDAKAAEQEAQRQARQFQDLVEGSLQGMMIHRRDRILFANQAFADMVGYPAPEALYALESLDRLIAPEDRDRLAVYAERLQRREPLDGPFEFRAVRRDGSRVSTLNVARIVRWQGQDAIQTTCIDITRRRQAEQALAEKEWQLNRAQRAAHIGSFHLDATTGEINWTDEMFRLLGLEPGSIPASLEAFLERVVPEDRAIYHGARIATLERGAPMSVELRIVRADGALRLLRMRGEAVGLREGLPPQGMAGMLEDITEARARDAALRASEERFRDLVEGSLQGIAIVQERNVAFANTAYLRMYGLASLAELERLGGPMSRVAPHERSRLDEYAQARLQGLPAPESYEMDCLRADGHPISVYAMSRVVSWDGRPATQVTVIDITERKRAEQELRASQALLRQVIDTAPMWIFVKDTASNYVMINKAMAEFFQIDQDDVPQMNTRRLNAPPEVIAKALEDDQKVYRSGKPLVQPVEAMTSPAGRMVWYQSTKVPLFDAAGGLIGLLGANVDVTEQMLAQESLRLKEHAIASSIEAIAFVDLDWRIREVNASFLELWGLANAAEALGRRAIEFWWSPEDAEPAVRAVGRNGSWAGETQGLRPGGARFPIDLRISTVLDLAGRPVWRMASAVDISARLQAEETQRELEDRLFQAHKMESVGRLAGGIAHDFNNMLTPIMGYAEVALDALNALDAQHPARRAIEGIASAAERAADLTRQLLAFGRRRTLRKSSIAVGQEIASVIGMLRRVVQENVDIQVRIDPQAGSIEADPSLLQQMVTNLVLNARDAMPTGGTLLVEARGVALAAPGTPGDLPPGPYVQITVSDTGQGMGEDVLDRIFEPFYTTKAEGRGTGLGLAVVYGIVKQHGGHIQVHSRVGAGSTFEAWLPRGSARAAAGPAPPPATPAAPAGEGTILVVEDNAEVRELVTSILAAHGYRVLQAAAPSEALAALRRHEGALHLILCDVVLPETGGPELVVKLRRIRPEARVLFMTGHPKDYIEQLGLDASDVPILDKPFTPQRLLEAVHSVLAAPLKPLGALG